MITPRFFCSQTHSSVVVAVYCPAVRASDVEIHVDDSLLSVHIAPYFLRLNFPGNVLEDDASSAVYDPASAYLTVTLTKETPGQDFPDLDLLAKLLAPRPTPRGPIIEVLDSQDVQGTDTAEQDLIEQTSQLSLDPSGLTAEQREILEAAANDWQLPQAVPEPLHTSLAKPYGFLDMYTGYFRHVANTENEINELGADAETLPSTERRRRRIAHEESKWDEEYYAADYADTEYVDELLTWTHPHLRTPDDAPFSEAENLAMLRLPRKEYLPTPAQTHSLYLTLVTLLFSYAYDARTTQHDPSPESAWTVCTLTPAFSALDPPPYAAARSRSLELAAALTASYRRALAFPLHRSWALAEACRHDAAAILMRGTRAVVRSLLEVRAVLDAHEVYYVYSRIWVDDLCSWVQAYASEEKLKELGHAVDALGIRKDMTGWDLEDLESAVDDVQERTSDSDDESEDEVERMVPAQL